MRKILLAAALLASVVPGEAQAQDACSIVQPRINQLQLRLNVLALDYPMTFKWVCTSLKNAVSSSGKDAAAALVMQYTLCAAFSSAEDCNKVIFEFLDVVKTNSSVDEFATKYACPYNHIKDPC